MNAWQRGGRRLAKRGARGLIVSRSLPSGTVQFLNGPPLAQVGWLLASPIKEVVMPSAEGCHSQRLVARVFVAIVRRFLEEDALGCP